MWAVQGQDGGQDGDRSQGSRIPAQPWSPLSPENRRAVAKAGMCPVVLRGSLGPCLELCDTDSDCPSATKCCSTGCGHVCKPPTEGKATSKTHWPGHAPLGCTTLHRDCPLVSPTQGVVRTWGPICCPMGQELGKGLTLCSQGSSPSPEGCPARRGEPLTPPSLHMCQCGPGSARSRRMVTRQPSAFSCACRTGIVPPARNAACEAVAAPAPPHCRVRPPSPASSWVPQAMHCTGLSQPGED